METSKEIESLVLVDEDENEIEFDIMDRFEFDGANYFVLLPVDYDDDEIEYVILRDDGNESLCGIEDGDLLDRVFEEYKKRNIAED
ncbi:MAG: DUF1292 domain-containing protein [Clostridia bacterium]|nr:DUF1292 domain-containing protein [Clostridia bacterium]